MSTPQHSLGQYGEGLAADYLATHGYEIIARNWRCAQGELDIVARDGAEWVFIEVRTRRAPDTTSAIESVTPLKQDRILQAVQAYLEAHDLHDAPWRVDWVVIALTPRGRQIEVIKNAVGW